MGWEYLLDGAHQQGAGRRLAAGEAAAAATTYQPVVAPAACIVQRLTAGEATACVGSIAPVWHHRRSAASGGGATAVPAASAPPMPAEGGNPSTVPATVPVVLLDQHIPSQLTLAYLADRYGDMLVPLELNSPNQKTVRLKEYLQFPPGAPDNKLYLRNLHVSHWFPAEADSMVTPPVLGANLLGDPIRTPRCPDEWRNWCELFVSNKDCEGFPVLHIDVCNIHAFSMQIQGIKRFTIFAPSDAPYLYTMAPAHTSSGLPTDLEQVSDVQFPLFKKATPIYVDLAPGETLFMPAGWWHTAKAISTVPSVTVAGSLVSEDNYVEFRCQHTDFLAAQSLIKFGALTLQ